MACSIATAHPYQRWDNPATRTLQAEVELMQNADTPQKNTRIAVNGGSFAASIIGHTSQKERIPAEEGLTGVEWLIEKKKIFLSNKTTRLCYKLELL